MMKLLSIDDFPALFDFEQRNRDFFTQFVPARPDSYFEYNSFCAVQNELLAEQESGTSAYFIGFHNDKLAIRANLRNITGDCANLGYRTCQNSIGKGIATQAVTELIETAKIMGLQKITATVANNNFASRRVLEKNLFEYISTEEKVFELNNIWLDFLYFEKRIQHIS